MAGAEAEKKPRRDLGLALVPVRLDVKIQGRHFREAFCVEPNVEELYILNITKQLCSEVKLSKSCEHFLFVLIKDQVDKFRESLPQLQIGEGNDKAEVIRLNFNIGQTHVEDKFLWNVGDPDADPEAFATIMCEDLRLPRTFVPEISCRIREQIVECRKKGTAAPQTSEGHLSSSTGGENLDSSTSKRERIPDRKSIYNSVVVRKRATWGEWGPRIRELTDAEVKQLENQAKKPRLQSSQAGGGVVNPEKSNRTPSSKTDSGFAQNSTAPKRQAQRAKNPRSKVKDQSSAPPFHLAEPQQTSAPIGPPPMGMVPVNHSLPLQQPAPVSVGGGSLVPNQGPMHVYNGAIQQTMPNSLGNPWSNPQSMNRMSTPGGVPNGLVEQYMQINGLHNQSRPTRPEVGIGNGMHGGQPDTMLHGSLGNLVGGPYQNGGMMAQYQNSQPHMSTRIHWNGW